MGRCNQLGWSNSRQPSLAQSAWVSAPSAAAGGHHSIGGTTCPHRPGRTRAAASWDFLAVHLDIAAPPDVVAGHGCTELASCPVRRRRCRTRWGRRPLSTALHVADHTGRGRGRARKISENNGQEAREACRAGRSGRSAMRLWIPRSSLRPSIPRPGLAPRPRTCAERDRISGVRHDIVPGLPAIQEWIARARATDVGQWDASPGVARPGAPRRPATYT